MPKTQHSHNRGRNSKPVFNVAITYRPAGGRALIVATVTDRELLSLAAEMAMMEAAQTADHLSKRDPVLGQIQGAEASKLNRILRNLVLPDEQECPVGVM